MKRLHSFFRNTLSETSVIKSLSSLVLIIVIFYLLSNSSDVWGGWLALIFQAFKPFLIGFLIAYILSPFVEMVEHIVKKRALAILIVILLFISIITVVILIAIPSIFVEIQGLVSATVDGITYLTNFLKDRQFYGINELLMGMNINILDYISVQNITNTITQLVANSSSMLVNVTLRFFTAILTFSFYTILAIYFLSNEDKVKRSIASGAYRIDPNLPIYLQTANLEMRKFLGSFGIVMLSKLPQYWLLFYIFGHRSWFILGILNMFAILVPYVGPITVNFIALITALSQGPIAILGTLFTIGWSSFVDQYYIEPKIYGSRVKLSPLLLLFGVFFNATLFGVIGVVFAIPQVLIIRSTYTTYRMLHPQDENEKLPVQ